VQLQRIPKVVERFVFRVSLTRNVNLHALSHEPFILLPNAGGKFLFHFINALLSQSHIVDQKYHSVLPAAHRFALCFIATGY
jgi:hypothetical protein